jgi:transcription elongation factor Elf1
MTTSSKTNNKKRVICKFCGTDLTIVHYHDCPINVGEELKKMSKTNKSIYPKCPYGLEFDCPKCGRHSCACNYPKPISKRVVCSCGYIFIKSLNEH